MKIMIEDVLSFNNSKFKRSNSRNIKLWKEKGITCSHCKKDGTYFLLEKGVSHLYTEDGILMTKDHIIPLSKGGLDELKNLQPLCERCNKEKGSNVDKIFKLNAHIKSRKRFNIKTITNINKISFNTLTSKKELKLKNYIEFVKATFSLSDTESNFLDNFRIDKINELHLFNINLIEKIQSPILCQKIWLNPSKP